MIGDIFQVNDQVREMDEFYWFQGEKYMRLCTFTKDDNNIEDDLESVRITRQTMEDGTLVDEDEALIISFKSVKTNIEIDDNVVIFDGVPLEDLDPNRKYIARKGPSVHDDEEGLFTYFVYGRCKMSSVLDRQRALCRLLNDNGLKLRSVKQTEGCVVIDIKRGFHGNAVSISISENGYQVNNDSRECSVDVVLAHILKLRGPSQRS